MAVLIWLLLLLLLEDDIILLYNMRWFYALFIWKMHWKDDYFWFSCVIGNQWRLSAGIIHYKGCCFDWLVSTQLFSDLDFHATASLCCFEQPDFFSMNESLILKWFVRNVLWFSRFVYPSGSQGLIRGYHSLPEIVKIWPDFFSWLGLTKELQGDQ